MVWPEDQVKEEVKLEIDIADDPDLPGRTGHQGADSTHEWSEINSVSPANTCHETETLSQSAAVMKSESDRQTQRCHSFQAEPVDQNVTGDGCHQFQSVDSKQEYMSMKHRSCTCVDPLSTPEDFLSVDSREENVDMRWESCTYGDPSATSADLQAVSRREENVSIKWESCTCADCSSKPVDFLNAVNSVQSKTTPWVDTSKVKVTSSTVHVKVTSDNSDFKNETVSSGASSDVIKTESAYITNDVIKSELVTADITNDVIDSEPVLATSTVMSSNLNQFWPPSTVMSSSLNQ